MATVYLFYCDSGFKSNGGGVLTDCISGSRKQIAVDTSVLQPPASSAVPALNQQDVVSVFSVGFSMVLLSFLVGRAIGSILSLIRKG